MVCQACIFGEVLKETGDIDWLQIAARGGVSVQQAQEHLSSIGLTFRNPRTNGWETSSTYLSGNLRAKLREAEAAAAVDLTFRANVEALRKIQPPELKPDQIAAPLGAGWIPEEYIEQFAQSLGLGVNAEYVPELAKWIVYPTDKFRKIRRRSEANNKRWGTKYVDAVDLLEQALNSQEPTVTKRTGPLRKEETDLDQTYEARDKQKKIKEEFERWLWSNQTRAERLARLFNDRFNVTIRPYFDGSHLTDLPGLNKAVKLRSHQKNAIYRLISNDGQQNSFLVHSTGAGKTLVMIVSAMEMRRLGKRRRVLQIVPNNRATQHASDFRWAYPNARLLVVTSEDLTPARFNETMLKIAGFDGDAVIMTHSASERIKMRPETEIDFVRHQVEAYDKAIARLPAGAVRKRRLLEATRDRRAKKLADLLSETADDSNRLSWEDLGIDQLFVDEAHRYKNLEFATRKQGVAGINPSGSARAFEMFMKVRYLEQHCNRCGKFVGEDQVCRHCGHPLENAENESGNICFASATPLDNSIAEMYTWMRFLQPKRLKRLGLEHFDGWSGHFARPTTILELAPFGGGYREATRFASFENVQRLSTIFSEVADVQLDPQKLAIPLPKEIKFEEGPKIVASPMSDRLRKYMAYCDERAAKVRAREVPLSEDNFLKIAGNLNMAALDYRLIDLAAADDPDSKVNLLVKDVLNIYRKTSGVTLPGMSRQQNLAQVIFLDLSTPKKGFNLYDDIKEKLMTGGIPEQEIEFIHDAKTPEAKQRLFDRVNAGEVRVLLASSDMGGEGANFQARLCWLHHLDVPWTPRKVIQRRGRMVRQGNYCPEVGTSVYVTAGSFDKYRWQTVERKALMGDQALRGDLDKCDDIDVVHIDYATIKAMASGNPMAEKRVKLQLDLQRYQALERVHQVRREEAQKGLDQALSELTLIEREAIKDAEMTASKAELANRIAQYRTTLSEPFEYSQTLKELQEELKKVEREIELSNQLPHKRGIAGKLLRKLFNF